MNHWHCLSAGLSDSLLTMIHLMSASKKFAIRGKVWKYEGPAGWFFIYIDKEISGEILELMKGRKKVVTEGKKKAGFGFIPVQAKLGKSVWDTAIFPSKEKKYLLAIKGSIRKKEAIFEGDTIDVELTLA